MNALKQRFGPFPVWVWLALITALALTWYLWTSRKNAASSAATAAAAPAAADDGTTGGTPTPDQSTTPPAEPGLTAAQTAELAQLPGEVEQLQDVDQQQNKRIRGKENKPPAKPKRKPRPRRRPVARPPQPVPGRRASFPPASHRATLKA